jgi:hypothetical protein
VSRPPRIPLDDLRESIARSLAGAVKSYELPGVAERLGLTPGTTEDANQSKRLYVRARIRDFNKAQLLRLADTILLEYECRELADLVSEMTAHAVHRVTELTRRDVLKALNPLETLFGDVNLFEGLGIISTESLKQSAFEDILLTSPLVTDIRRHYQRFWDWSHEELLIKCGALGCSQTRFFQLLEKLLDPVVRRGEEQTHLAESLNAVLAADGFHLTIVGETSRYPIYRVQRIASGVQGKPKNLIFAAVNAKPDLYFTDAINNDIAIGNVSDALIYDEFLSDQGLAWNTLVNWWQAQHTLENEDDARRNLYRRLWSAVKASGSHGAMALFDSYYREFPARLGDNLPALIPEVYLHYDPRTLRERGADPVLLRQRMDLLFLLNHNVRVVIEVDGSQHYSQAGKAAPHKYAEMVGEDRSLRLAGYEIYRFGGAEFPDTTTTDAKVSVGPRSRAVAVGFFERLWRKHAIKLDASTT